VPQARDWNPGRLSILIAAGLAAAVLLLEILDAGFVALNRRGIVLPQFDVTLIPYHDPRVTRRAALLLRYQKPPRLIFTGDSRVKNNIDPEVVAAAAGVAPETLFNFGTGSQVVKFAREAFLSMLDDLGARPEFVVFGVSPDWPLAKRKLWDLIDRYHESLAYRMKHPSPEQDPTGAALSDFLMRRYALLRYRGDLTARELVPTLRCWVLGDCFESVTSTTEMFTPLYWRDQERLSGFKTPYGWEPQPWEGRTSGRFIGRARFDESVPVDRESLFGLIREARARGMAPLLLVMPVHDTFRAVHEPVMSRRLDEVEAIALQEGVPVLKPRSNYSAPNLFTDGHHMSRLGATQLGQDVGELLAPFLTRWRQAPL